MSHYSAELVAPPTIGSKAFFLDLGDRLVKTFVQNVALFFVGTATILTVPWTQVLLSSALACLVTVLIAVTTASSITTGNPYVDILDRAGRTFVGTLVGAIPAVGGLLDVDWKHALSFAGTAAMLSILTSLATLNFGAVRGLPSLAPVIPPALPVIDPTGEPTEFRGR